MANERPKGRYYAHKETLEQKIQSLKPLNVHTLHFNMVLDDVRTKLAQTKLREALYDLRRAPYWDEEEENDDFFTFLQPGAIDSDAICTLMVNRLEHITCGLRDIAQGGESRPTKDDDFRDQEPWVPIIKMPPKWGGGGARQPKRAWPI